VPSRRRIVNGAVPPRSEGRCRGPAR